MAPLLPRNIYGVSKLTAEHLSRLFHELHGLPVTVLRTSRFFPEADDMAHTIVQSDENTKANEFLFRRLTVEDAAESHVEALKKVPERPQRRSRRKIARSLLATRLRSSGGLSHNMPNFAPEWGGRCSSQSIVSMIPTKRAAASDLRAGADLAKSSRSCRRGWPHPCELACANGGPPTGDLGEGPAAGLVKSRVAPVRFEDREAAASGPTLRGKRSGF